MPVYSTPGVYVEEVPPLARPIAGVGTSTPGFIGVIPDQIALPARPVDADTSGIKTQGYKFVTFNLKAEKKQFYQITSWSQYTSLFGDFLGDSEEKPATGSPKLDSGQRLLAHAVYGFFNNGGSSCFVLRVASSTDLAGALEVFAAIDDITIVAAPGLSSATDHVALISHCETLKDRVAILDSVETDTSFDKGDFSLLKKVEVAGSATAGRPQNSTYAAFYFPWLQVFDPAAALMKSGRGDGLVRVPPSGHIAGVYAKTDTTRGVFKAPANEGLQGVTGLAYSLSKEAQGSLNEAGVNLIRYLIGGFRVWGARTVGGVDNGEFRYISTRRYFNFLRESIFQGTQFVVFEPNTPVLWERIKRTVGGFLLNQWREGGLFGTTPEKAFYVRCDADTNPPETRENGQVIIEIGVAIVKPAEFVIFRVQQMAGA